MRIVSVETEVKYIPLKTPFITALRRVENIEFVRVKVVCENGITAYGEAPATKAITGEDIETILDSIDRTKEFFIGKLPQEALEILHQEVTRFQVKPGMTNGEYSSQSSEYSRQSSDSSRQSSDSSRQSSDSSCQSSDSSRQSSDSSRQSSDSSRQSSDSSRQSSEYSRQSSEYSRQSSDSSRQSSDSSRHSRLDLESSLLSQSNIKNSAKAALDMAFLSLIAKEKKIPLYQLFGANKPIALQTDITISLKDVDEMLQDSVAAFKTGMKILKIKLGSDIKHSIEIIQSISRELPKAKILVDANQAWSLQDSLEFVNALKDVKIELIEQPVIAQDLEALKTITNATQIFILADESAFDLEDVKRVIESKSADMINIKLMKCGGLTNAVKILEYAREHSVVCMLGSMLEGPLSINAALHLAMAYSDVIKYIDLDSPLLYRRATDELDFIFNGAKIVYDR